MHITSIISITIKPNNSCWPYSILRKSIYHTSLMLILLQTFLIKTTILSSSSNFFIPGDNTTVLFQAGSSLLQFLDEMRCVFLDC